MKHIELGVIIAIIIILCCYAGCRIDSDKNEAAQWVATRGEIAERIDYKNWFLGPYWHNKSLRVYRVKTNKNIYWIRYGHWIGGPDVYIERDGDYKELAP